MSNDFKVIPTVNGTDVSLVGHTHAIYALLDTYTDNVGFIAATGILSAGGGADNSIRMDANAGVRYIATDTGGFARGFDLRTADNLTTLATFGFLGAQSGGTQVLTNAYIGALYNNTWQTWRSTYSDITVPLKVGAAGAPTSPFVIETAGPVSIVSNGSAFRLVGTAQVYMGFYPDGVAAGRKAFIGFGSDAVIDLTIAAEETNGGISFMASAARKMYMDTIGQLAVGGAHAPQGAFHAHDGVGGCLFTTKSAINTTAQVIIANGTGDVVRGVYCQYTLYCSTGTVTQYTGLVPGGNLSIILGATTFSLRCNADGSLDIRRTAGTADGILSIQCIWV